MKKFILPLMAIFMLGVSTNALGQSSSSTGDSFSSLIQSGPGDATKLINAYANPLFKGFGSGWNSGWNNTAKTKKFLHFELRISATAAQAPTSDKSFDVSQLGLANIKPADPSQTLSPTIVGDKTQGPLLNVYDNNGKQITQFNMPKGVLPAIPSPQVQLTLGLVKNTDVTVRYVPQISFGNSGSVNMFGFGLKHDIIQDFATKKRPIPFDLAIAFGYNSLTTNIGLTVNPDAGAIPANNQQSTDFSNQKITAKFNSFMVQAIISKKLLFFTPFLSVGYNTASNTITTVGNYPITTGVNGSGNPTYTTFTNPVNIQSTPLSGFRTDAGFQLNLLILRIYASYGLTASYKSANVGIGLGF